jgi:D-serine deaminase-like pyridoxal phosphate-dependent protein
VDPTTKGFPAVAERVPVLDVGLQGWSLEDLVPPVLVLRESALRHNLALMASYCDRHGVELAPHGKTSMAPQLWDRQLGLGAWGLTAATAVQARVMRGAGVRRILVANELVDRASMDWAAAELADPSVDLLCYVDSTRGVEILEGRLSELAPARPLRVLVELGYPGGRTGCRSTADALGVAERVRRSQRLELAGVAGYEGTICHDRSAACLEAVRAYLGRAREATAELVATGAFDDVDEVMVTAGGSIFFDLVTEQLGGPWPAGLRARVLLRSGCYLTHDSGLYERASPFASARDPGERFRPAIEVWGAVLSIPEPALAVVGLGRRDAPSDQGMPVPHTVRSASGRAERVEGRLSVWDLNDQHAYCRLDLGLQLGVGDLVGFGISHPCTAFDRWRVIPVLDDDDRVVDAVATFF